jgi:hypothetical protein
MVLILLILISLFEIFLCFEKCEKKKIWSVKATAKICQFAFPLALTHFPYTENNLVSDYKEISITHNLFALTLFIFTLYLTTSLLNRAEEKKPYIISDSDA